MCRRSEGAVMEKVKRTALAALYAGGCAAVILLLLLTAIGGGRVLFPEAMLPMELRELASAWLAIGFLPMVMVSRQLYQSVRRKIVFLPSAVCLLALLFWVGVWTVGMFRSPAMALGGDIVLPQADLCDDEALETQLRKQIALELAAQTTEQE